MHTFNVSSNYIKQNKARNFGQVLGYFNIKISHIWFKKIWLSVLHKINQPAARAPKHHFLFSLRGVKIILCPCCLWEPGHKPSSHWPETCCLPLRSLGQQKNYITTQGHWDTAKTEVHVSDTHVYCYYVQIKTKPQLFLLGWNVQTEIKQWIPTSTYTIDKYAEQAWMCSHE